MYVCGITAYDYCHIGHARSAVVFDVLIRYLRYLGLEVTFVRNFTDVDDKIINRRLDPGFTHTTIAADVGPGVDRAGVVDDLSARLGARASAVTDHRSSVEAEMGAYMSTVPVISAALTVLIVVMTLLVIGLVVGASLRRARRDMGVCRALGYTTGQLVSQMQWEHLPMVAAGAALGALIDALTLNRLLGLVVGALGVVLVDLPLDLKGAGLIALGIIALASAATALSYLGIRRVGTAELIKE